MADDNKVTAESRDSFGKGAARKIRAAGKIPAVIYGHGAEPQHVTLPAHQLGLLLRKANAVIQLDIAGQTELTLVKDVQKDPVRQIIEHIDLIAIRQGEKVQVEVPVHIEGDPFGSGIVELDLATLHLEAEATHIPERIAVSVEGLEAGVRITAGGIVLPQGVNLLTDPEVLVVGVVAPAAATEEETAAEAASESAAE